MREEGVIGLAIVGLLAAGALGGTIVLLSMRREEPPPEEEEPPPEEPEEIVDATLEKGYVWWAGLTEWKRVSTTYPNTWPLDTDITFSWEIKNTGNVGAYFQVYIASPGAWLYIGPGEKITVEETLHTPVVPVSPGYEYYEITILGRKLSGERIGAVWVSDDIEVSYV